MDYNWPVKNCVSILVTHSSFYKGRSLFGLQITYCPSAAFQSLFDGYSWLYRVPVDLQTGSGLFLFCRRVFFPPVLFCFHGFCSNRWGWFSTLTNHKQSLEWHHQTLITRDCAANPICSRSRQACVCKGNNNEWCYTTFNWNQITV